MDTSKPLGADSEDTPINFEHAASVNIPDTIWDIFDIFDENKNQKIEFEEIFNTYGYLKKDTRETSVSKHDFDLHLTPVLKAHCDYNKNLLQYETVRWSLPKGDPRNFFEMMDENRDGKVTASEFFKPFYWADTKKDYFISPAELNSYFHKYYVNFCIEIRTKPLAFWL